MVDVPLPQWLANLSREPSCIYSDTVHTVLCMKKAYIYAMAIKFQARYFLNDYLFLLRVMCAPPPPPREESQEGENME